jgi:uncharacterized repeat protein (TIGR01451 family)
MRTLTKIAGAFACLALALGLFGPLTVQAATTPSLGAAASYAVLTGTYTNSSAATTVNGDIGFTTAPATPPLGAHANYGSGAPYATAHSTDAPAALGILNLELPCTFNFPAGSIDVSTDGPNGATGVYTAGIYCSTGAMNIGVGGITLNGPGTFIFRAVGALTSTTGSTVTLGAGVSACDVFWTATAATSLANLTHFEGNIIDNANAITLGANTTMTGRAISLGAGTVSTGSTDTITAPTCAASASGGGSSRGPSTITVVKTVINGNGGTKTVADFPLFVNGIPVISGATNVFPAPADVYRVTETSDPNYTRSFSGDCDATGGIALNPGNANICVLTNTYTGAPAVVAPLDPPLIDVIKIPSPLALPAGPGSVTYTYTLKNIGIVPVGNITMIDNACSTLNRVSGDTNNNNKLDLNEVWTYTCQTNLTQTTTNIVVATGTANGFSTSSVANATVIVGTPVIPPLIHVTKVPSSFTLPAGGGTITYTEKITNPGTVATGNITLTDDKCSPMKYVSGDLNHDYMIEPDETFTYTCTTKLTKTTTNTATASGTANGMTVHALAIATVVVAPVIPKLPNTGFAPTFSIKTIIALAASAIALAALVFMALKKQNA